MKFYFPILFVLLLTACTQNNEAPQSTTPAPATANADGLMLEDMPGTTVKRATKKNAQGKIKEKGYVLDGKRTGMWEVFDRSDVFPQKIISYQNGMYNGSYYEFTERGQLNMKAFYVNNQLDGYFAKYKFSKEVVTANYKNGKLEGEYREFDERKNFLTKVVNYKDGLQHGRMAFYNEAGEIVAEYQYKNGEKVSGGIVNGQ